MEAVVFTLSSITSMFSFRNTSSNNSLVILCQAYKFLFKIKQLQLQRTLASQWSEKRPTNI
jgi:hypothetical protein